MPLPAENLTSFGRQLKFINSLKNIHSQDKTGVKKMDFLNKGNVSLC